MNQTEKARQFTALHVKGDPVVLYNAWDAGSAKAILEAGAKAIATSSWAVAEAQGYRDGELIPLQLVEQTVSRIVSNVDAPVSVDFEGAYSDDNVKMADNIARLLDLGVVGINFEDRIVQGSGLYDIDRQNGRIAAIRAAAEKKRVSLFINARTDVFVGEEDRHAHVFEAALNRANAYAKAGASGLFVPGLRDERLIGQLCERVQLPVNVMITDGSPPLARLRQLGVSRISYGPTPYLIAMDALQQHATEILRDRK